MSHETPTFEELGRALARAVHGIGSMQDAFNDELAKFRTPVASTADLDMRDRCLGVAAPIAPRPMITQKLLAPIRSALMMSRATSPLLEQALASLRMLEDLVIEEGQNGAR